MVFKKLLKGKKDADSDVPSSSAAGPEEHVSYHPDADENGGMLCTNDELLKQQREAIMQWVKSMGKRLLTGNINLINTPFPVTIFEPRSYLEKLADVWVYPRYLTAAAQTTDPMERMKLVATWFVAGLHHAFENWRKPFNPILGETWQATLSDGTTMDMEQISHHPPVTAFHMEGAGGAYRFRGLSQPTVSIVVKYYGFKTVAKGFRYIDFNDGSRIELHYPQYFLKNVVYAPRPRAEVDGQAILVDVKNKLKAVITFGPLKGARNKVLRRNDAVHGFIYDCRNNQASLEEQTSTADVAGVTGQERGAAHRAAGHDGHDDDGEEFESASENEYDPEREDADASGELERVAMEAAAAERALDGDADSVGPTDAGDVEPGASGAGAATAGVSRLSLNGHGSGSGLPPALTLPSSMGAATSSLPHSGSIPSLPSPGAAAAPATGSSSFFSMSTFNRVGNLLNRMSGGPQMPSSADPTSDESEGVAVAAIEGSWLSHVNVDGQRMWSVATEKPDRWRPVAHPLPSDCRFRADLSTLAAGDLKGAQRAKEALENSQRADKKLRGHH